MLKQGASLGANSTIIGGLTIGKYAMIVAGSAVTKNVSDYALVYGNPAQLKGYVCECGSKLIDLSCESCCKSSIMTNNILSRAEQSRAEQVNDDKFYGLISQKVA